MVSYLCNEGTGFEPTSHYMNDHHEADHLGS